MEYQLYPSGQRSLTNVVMDCQNDVLDIKQATDIIAEHVYTYETRRWNIRRNEDEFSDFITEFYQRIPNIIRTFRYYGIPFEHYLRRCIKLWGLAFYKRRSRNMVRDASLELENAPLFRYGQIDYAHDNRYNGYKTGSGAWQLRENRIDMAGVLGEIIGEPPGGGASVRLTGYQRNRILVIALKCTQWISCGQLRQVARITGVKYRHLYALCERLRIRYADTFNTANHFMQSLDRLFHRLMSYYLRLQDETNTISQKNMLLDNIRTLREKIYSKNVGETRVRLAPSNSEISQLLGIPKGTVDSTMRAMRKDLRQRYNERVLLGLQEDTFYDASGEEGGGNGGSERVPVL